MQFNSILGKMIHYIMGYNNTDISFVKWFLVGTLFSYLDVLEE